MRYLYGIYKTERLEKLGQSHIRNIPCGLVMVYIGVYYHTHWYSAPGL